MNYQKECFNINENITKIAMKSHEESENRKNEWINNWIESNCPEGRTVKTYYKALKSYNEYKEQ